MTPEFSVVVAAAVGALAAILGPVIPTIIKENAARRAADASEASVPRC